MKPILIEHARVITYFKEGGTKDCVEIVCSSCDKKNIYTGIITSRYIAQAMVKEFANTGVLVGPYSTYIGKHSRFFKWENWSKIK